MGIMANIVCKTAGVAGMSAILYDAYSLGKANSKRYSENAEADRFIKIHSETRTLSTESAINNAMQKRVEKWRTDMPLVSTVHSVKGFVSGFLGSLADNIIPSACSALALAAKGVTAKIGACGLAVYAVYKVAKEGFGFTKKTPMS